MIIALSAGRDSSPELRARLALDEPGVRMLLRKPGPGIGGMVVLSTCHRTEVYAIAEGSDAEAVHTVVAMLPQLHPSDQQELRAMRGSEAVEHLFRVACGLDSLVIGEPQVLGQVRRALVLAQEESAVNGLLSSVFQRAIRLGRRARNETSLGGLGLSVGRLTAQHLDDWFDGLSGRSAAVVGAGEAATDAAGSLRGAGASISVLSRHAASARRLAVAVGGTAYPMDQMADVFARSDCAVVAISGGVQVHPEHLPVRAPLDAFVVIDISAPPSVDVAGRSDVQVRTLEDLPAPHGPETAAAVVDAEAMVKGAVAELERWLDTRASGRAVGDLRMYADNVVRAEVARVAASIDLSEAEAERLAAIGMRISNKLLHGPSVAMKDADEQTRTQLRRIFGIAP